MGPLAMGVAGMGTPHADAHSAPTPPGGIPILTPHAVSPHVKAVTPIFKTEFETSIDLYLILDTCSLSAVQTILSSSQVVNDLAANLGSGVTLLALFAEGSVTCLQCSTIMDGVAALNCPMHPTDAQCTKIAQGALCLDTIDTDTDSVNNASEQILKACPYDLTSHDGLLEYYTTLC
jgi:hypothetical protein